MRTNAIAGGRRFEPGRIGAIFAAMGAFGVLVSNPTAQQSGGTPRVHLNQIIEQFEQGRPAIANEHWVFFTLTNNPFTTIPLATARSTAWTSGSVAAGS